MKYVPNAITLLRLLMVPVFAGLYFSASPNAPLYALAIFLAAGATDLLDGYLARKYNAVSVIGIVLDPLADKFMLLTALACLAIKGVIPLWTLVLMLVVEGILIVSGIYFYFNKKKEVIPAGKLGKSATVIFVAAVSMMIVVPEFSLSWVIFCAALAAKVLSLAYYSKGFIERRRAKGK